MTSMLKAMVRPIILLVSSIVLYIIEYQEIGIIIFLLFLIDNYNKLYYYNKKENSQNEFINQIDKAVSENLFNVIYPIVLINKSGDIIWNNNMFESLKQKNEMNILSIASELDLSLIERYKKNDHQRIHVSDKLYDVYSRTVKANDETSFYILSFNDITKLIDYETTKESIMLIEVDNLTEVLNKTDEGNRPLVIAEIGKYIRTYAESMKAMIQQYDASGYVLSVQDKYIEKEIREKFKIIDDISKINKGNTMRVTLSIGVGRLGMSPMANYNNAKKAKELALGRGGAQAIVKSKDDLKIFGGNSKEIEKRTKVKARVIARALSELIYESRQVFILGHKNPDMDCFGSAVGLMSVIRQLGKKCKIVLPKETNDIRYYLDMLNKDEKYNDTFLSVDEAESNIDRDTLLIILDVHNKGYVESMQLVNMADRKVIIDHHRRSPDIIENNMLKYIEIYASSTAEMVTEIIQYMVDKPAITPLEAEGLLAGIIIDTKKFSFKTGVRTFDAASFLKSYGAEPLEIKKMFADNIEDYTEIADTIKSARIKEGVAVAVAPANVHNVIIAKAADELLNIAGVEVSFVLGEIADNVLISGRSLGDINVQVVLEELGGGGHMNIAGTKMSNISIDDAILKLDEAINKCLRIGE
ncbi:DHH family phosphoesterase [Clostridium sp. BJN0001]|uniref:DHH family phosphoesterase n=1 Tax=Clostridium sp. BJN0001 TaxID=2930219 RepID=UPI001FD2B6EB|nr:DHH family phosphoesterase [Clostridium sp. BJN0001]